MTEPASRPIQILAEQVRSRGPRRVEAASGALPILQVRAALSPDPAPIAHRHTATASP